MSGEEDLALAPRRGDFAVDAVPVLQPRGDVDLRFREHRRPCRRRKLDFQYYREVLSKGVDGIWPYLLHSVIICTLATVGVLLISMPTAYGFSRLRSKLGRRPVPRLLHPADDAVPRAARTLVLHPQFHRADRHLHGTVVHLLHLPTPHGDLADEGLLRLHPLPAGGVRVDRRGQLVPHLPFGHPPAGIQRVRRHVGVRVHLLLHRVHVRLDLHPQRHGDPAALHRRPSRRRGRSGSS